MKLVDLIFHWLYRLVVYGATLVVVGTFAFIFYVGIHNGLHPCLEWSSAPPFRSVTRECKNDAYTDKHECIHEIITTTLTRSCVRRKP